MTRQANKQGGLSGIGAKSKKRRDWSEPHRKLLDEGECCRICDTSPADPAHLWARAAGGDESYENIVPLCREHHTEFDNGDIDLIHYLRPAEKARVVYLADQTQGLEGLEAARMRLRPSVNTSKRVARPKAA